MSQSFSLYTELTVRQNLSSMPGSIACRQSEMRRRDRRDAQPISACGELPTQKPPILPLGIRQRLQLAVAVCTGRNCSILDEPTSGVDPAARDGSWSC